LNRLGFFLILLSLITCSRSNDSKNNNALIISLLYNNYKNSQSDYNCKTSPSPLSFADFRTAIDTLNTSGYKCSECHGANTAQANFIITNYSSVGERVLPGNPKGSILYFKVQPGGSMNAYSNANVRQAIYCWIANGANP